MVTEDFRKMYIDLIHPSVDISHDRKYKKDIGIPLLEETSDKSLWDAHHANFDDNDYRVLKRYSNSSSEIKQDLKQHKYGYPLEYKSTIQQLDKTIAKNTLGKHVISYTGVSEDKIRALTNGKFPASGFTSTHTSSSLDINVASAFTHGEGNHILEIHHSPDHTAAYLGSKNKATTFDEDELLLPRNMHIAFNSPPRSEKLGSVEYNIWKVTRLD